MPRNTPDAAVRAAETAANDAVRATGLAIDAAKQAERHAHAVEQLVPDPQRELIASLAEHERSALLRVGPRRRWSELQSYDERLAEIEGRREELSREIGDKMADRHNEPQRLATEIDLWIVAGAKGARPQSKVAALDKEIAGLHGEHAAAGIAYDRLLGEPRARLEAPQANG